MTNPFPNLGPGAPDPWVNIGSIPNWGMDVLRPVYGPAGPDVSGVLRAVSRPSLASQIPKPTGFPPAASYVTPAHEAVINRAVNTLLSNSGPGAPSAINYGSRDPIRGLLSNMQAASYETPAGLQGLASPWERLGMPPGGPTTTSNVGVTNPNIFPQMGGFGRFGLTGEGSLLSRFTPNLPSGIKGYAGRGLGALGIYTGLQGAGQMVGTDNGAGYGLSSAAAPAALTYAATGAALPTALVGAGVGLGTGIAKLIRPENSWGNVGTKLQRSLGQWHPNMAVPMGVPLSAIAASYDENGKLDLTSMANALEQHGVSGADRTDDGKVTLTGDALKVLRTVRDNPDQYSKLGNYIAGLDSEERNTLDSAYSLALMSSDDPNSPQARDDAISIAKLAVEDQRTQGEQEKRFTEQALAFQSAAQQILAPVTANMDAQAQFSYNNMMSAIPSLPPELQGVAALQAQAQLQGSQMISNAYRAQAATMMPALWLGNQQDQFNQLVSQLQPQVQAAGLQALGIGGQQAGGGMTLADFAGATPTG